MGSLLKRYDTPLIVILGITLLLGFLMFLSASLGLLARNPDVSLTAVILRQSLGLILGIAALVVAARIPHQLWRTYGFYLFAASGVVMLFVFVPGIGVEAGGAARWIDLGVITFQPAELLKFTFVVYYASLLAGARRKLHNWQYGLVPTAGILAVVGALLLTQPDTGTFLVIAGTAVVMYVTAGAPWRDIGILALGGMLLAGGLVALQPYLLDRVTTFLNPTVDPTGAGYQIQQSLIAVGSGELFGRGFGQSVQKFNFLPEPVGDSIFAVAAEEFGFVGSMTLVALFLALCLRGLKIAANAPNYYVSYLAVGMTMLIFSQSFINIGAMLSLLPLTGMPLLFVSQGGSALVFALAEIGVILQVSRSSR